MSFLPKNTTSDIIIENITELPSHVHHSTPYELPFTNNDVLISVSILLPLALFGLIANFVTILVIYRSPKLKNVFNHILISLCFADFISTLITPLFLYRRTWGFNKWVISSFMCKLFWALDLWTAYVTSIHILLFALLRYFSLKSPSLYYKITSKTIKIVIFGIWTCTCLAGFLPFMLMFDSSEKDRHSKSVNSKWPACSIELSWLSTFINYSAAAYSVFFYVPFIFILILSISTILLILRNRENRRTIISTAFRASTEETLESKRRRKEHQAMIQLILIVGSFFLAYVPLTAYHFFSTMFVPTTQEDLRLDWWFGMVVYVCLRVSEVLNPVFYNLASTVMRKETYKFLSRCCTCSQVKYSETTEKSSTIPIPNKDKTNWKNDMKNLDL